VNGLIVMFSVIITVCLVSFSSMDRNWAIAFGFLSAILMLAIAIVFELHVLPKEFRRYRSDIAAAVAASHQHPILRLVLAEVLRGLREQVACLRNGTYYDERGKIRTLSVQTIESVRHSAFAAYIVDERERTYETPEGRTYIAAWCQKARELGDQGDVSRVFIVKSINEVTDETFCRMKHQNAYGVKVLLVEHDKVKDIAQGCELDFGLYDGNCVMTVTPRRGISDMLSLVVGDKGTNETYIRRYTEFKGRIIGAALDFESFARRFVSPINALVWNNRHLLHATRLNPPHGLSVKDATAIVDLALRYLPELPPLRIAILGVTPQLVDHCLSLSRIGEITLLDQASVSLPDKGIRVKRVVANWLEYSTDRPFDAILGDEALNNLTISQYGVFFRNMRRLLTPHGILVMRTLGQYEDATRFLKVTPDDLLRFIRDEAHLLPEGDCAARVISYLHSALIAFDEARCMIDTARYNNLLETWISRREIDEAGAARLWFPSREELRVVLSSPRTDLIFEASGRCFNQMPFVEVDSSYCGADALLQKFYRITPFVAKGDAIGLETGLSNDPLNGTARNVADG